VRRETRPREGEGGDDGGKRRSRRRRGEKVESVRESLREECKPMNKKLKVCSCKLVNSEEEQTKTKKNIANEDDEGYAKKK
jgi:hypothetical protein